MKDIFIAQVKNGRLSLCSDYNKARFQQWLNENEGKKLRIEPVKSTRTLSQNNYYWVYLTVISEDTGHTPEELHTLFKGMFLTKQIKKVLGKDVRITKSTTNLSKIDFGDYLDKICFESAIPLPDREQAGFILN